jgi:hypothetical protein
MPYHRPSYSTSHSSQISLRPSDPSYSTSQATIARTYPSRQPQQPVSRPSRLDRQSSHPYPKSPRPNQAKRSPRSGKAWLAGGSMAFLAAMAVVPTRVNLPTRTATNPVCQEVVRSEARLSRDQLSKFLSVPTQSSKTAIQGMLQTPYCRLTPKPDQSENVTARDAYPLAFDPDTWVVVLYEGETYVGYDFTFRH